MVDLGFKHGYSDPRTLAVVYWILFRITAHWILMTLGRVFWRLHFKASWLNLCSGVKENTNFYRLTVSHLPVLNYLQKKHWIYFLRNSWWKFYLYELRAAAWPYHGSPDFICLHSMTELVWYAQTDWGEYKCNCFRNQPLYPNT